MRTALLAVLLMPLVTTGLCAQEKPQDEWRPLFDGKTLDGWEHVGPGKMVMEDGLIRTEGGMGLLWYTREKFGDATIRVVYKTTDKASNSGIFIRIDGKPKDEWHAVHHGYEVQISDGSDAFHSTGSIYSLSKALASPSKVGEWNTMEIVLSGQKVVVMLNGVKVQDFDPQTAIIPERTKPYEPERGPRPEAGYIGLQNHDDVGQGKQVYFKEVSVRSHNLRRETRQSGTQGQSGTQNQPAQGQRPQITDAIRAEFDLSYAGTNNPRQKLDLYLPKSPKTNKHLPVVAYIHGGGWAEGNKRSGFRSLSPLVESGEYAMASIGYRLTHEAIWPAQIHDCKAAIRWIRANASKYNLDPDRIGVMGESAGGHLASMLGTSGGIDTLEGGPISDAGISSRVTCVVDQFGPTDFLMGSDLSDLVGFSPLDSPNSPVFRLIGGPLTKNKDKARDASPISYVSNDDPPFMLIHGTRDQVVPFVQSAALAAALKKAGVETVLVSVNGGGHGDFGTPEPFQRMRQFFDKHLLGKDETISAEPIKAGH